MQMKKMNFDKKKYFNCSLFCLSICFIFSDRAIAENLLRNNGFTYAYNSIPVRSDETDKIDYSKGQIKIEGSNGELVYFDETGYAPGCGNDLGAVSLLEYSYTNFPRLSSTDKNREFVLFCGNTSGHHFLVRVFQPHLGFVSVLDFQDGPVDISRDPDGIYSARVKYIFYSQKPHAKIEYPVYYRLVKVGTTLGFSDMPSLFSDSYYREYIRNKLDLFVDSNTKMHGYSAILVAIQTCDPEIFCNIVSKFKLLLAPDEIEELSSFIKHQAGDCIINTKSKCKEN